MQRLPAIGLMAAAIALSGCGNDEPKYNFVLQGIDPTDGPTVTAALDHFKTVCPGLFLGWQDVKEAVVKTGDPSLNYTGDAYGWTRELWIEVKVSDSPTHLLRAEGHTLYYLLGSGARTGMVIKKDVSAAACEVKPAGEGKDTFVPDDGFRMVAQMKG